MAYVRGTFKNDILDADDGVTEESDNIDGLAGNDVIYGLGGNDYIEGGAGADDIFGGDGIDWIEFWSSPSGVAVSLITGGVGGDANGDIYVDVENVRGSPFDDLISGNDVSNNLQGYSGRDVIFGEGGIDRLHGHDGNDVLFGGDGDDLVYGYEGNDTLYGDAGDDVLRGGPGADHFGGGDGSDYVMYGTSTGPLMINLQTGMIMGGDANGDTYTSIEDLHGAQFDDVLVGDGGQNRLGGDGGNDTLMGNAGNDHLGGYTGNDVLRGGAGADILWGMEGDADLADYLGATAAVSAALDGSLTGTGEALGDTFSSVERLRGSNFADTLRGDGGDNFIFGQTGNDTIDGRAGNDRIFGGIGIDTLTGAAGLDTFQYGALNEIGDNILDFASVDDTISVSATGFGGGLVAGVLGAALFQSSATNAAANATVRFIFENDVKILWFDADGNGAGVAVMVADLQASATMTSADILVV